MPEPDRRPGGFSRVQGSPAALLAIVVVYMIAVIAADTASPPDVHLGPLLAVAPAFTAGLMGPRATGGVGALSMASLVVIGLGRGVLGTENLIVQLCTQFALCVLLLVFSVVRERRKRQLAEVRSAYVHTSRSLLPEVPHRLGPLLMASRNHAAHPQQELGGDLYAAARTRHSTRVLIGDVRGKGLASLDALILVLGAFRASAHRQAPLPDLVASLEESVRWGLAEHTARSTGTDPEEQFITAAVLDVPDDVPEVRLVSCGHPAPLRVPGHAADPRVEPLVVEQPAPPLGLGELAATPYTPSVFPFSAGDTLLLYTDGAIEARGPRRDFYPLTERLPAAVRACGPAAAPEELLRRVWEDLVEFVSAPPDDDIALLALRRTVRSGGPSA